MTLLVARLPHQEESNDENGRTKADKGVAVAFPCYGAAALSK